MNPELFEKEIQRMRDEALAAKLAPIDPRQERMVEAKAVMATLPGFVQVPERLPDMIGSPKLRAAVEAWTPDEGNLVLLGPTKPGKTAAAALALWSALLHGVRVGGAVWDRVRWSRWQRATDLGAALKQHPLGKGEAPELGKCERASLLVLDDIGWETDSDPIADVLNRRYEAGRVTIITSGLPMTASAGAKSLTTQYGDAVCRRMVEVGGKRVKPIEVGVKA